MHTCEICGKEYERKNHYTMHMKKHVAAGKLIAQDDYSKMLAAMKMMEERNRRLEEKIEALEKNKLTQEELSAQVAQITKSVAEHQRNIKESYETEEQVEFMADDKGFVMTVNGYRVVIPPNTLGKVPKSFMQEIQQRAKLTRRAKEFDAAVRSISTRSQAEVMYSGGLDIGGTHFLLADINNRSV